MMITESLIDLETGEAFQTITVEGDQRLYNLTVEAWQNVLPMGFGIDINGLYME